MIKEVAFVAIAVSDKERARKFYQETLELKPTTSAMEGARHGNLREMEQQSPLKSRTLTRASQS